MKGFSRTLRSAFRKYAYVYPLLQLFVLVPIQWARTDQDRDVAAYHLAAARIDQGDPLYEPHPPPGPHVVDAWYYLYPPFLAAAVSIAPAARFETFARAWLIVLLLAFWVYAACLARLATGRVTRDGTLVAGALLGLTPGLMHALNMGQADVLVWAMAGIALAFPPARGAGFAAAALTKVTGVWPLAVAAVREPHRALRGAATVVLVAVAIAAAALGPRGFLEASRDWFVHVVPALGQGQFDPGRPALELRLPFGLGSTTLPNVTPTNLSVAFAPIDIARRAGWWHYDGGQLPGGMRVYLAAVAILAPLTAAWLFRRRPPELHYAAVLTAALLFAPIFKLTNLPILLAPIVIVWRLRRRPTPASPPEQRPATV